MGRAAITEALAALIATAVPGAAISGFTGGPAKPERVSSVGAIWLVATDTPEPEVDLCPLTYNFEPEFDLAIAAPTSARVLEMLAALGAAIQADRSLGGACEWLDADPGGFDEETMTGTDGHIEARVTVTAAYATTNPLE